MNKIKFAVLFVLFFLAACTTGKVSDSGSEEDSSGLLIPNADGSIPVQKDKQGTSKKTYVSTDNEDDDFAKTEEWITLTKKNHPDWYTCENDQDCVSVSAQCGSVCKSNAINSNAYSDYVVEHSEYCAGSGRTIRKCGYTEKSCEDGVCLLRYLS